MEIATFIAYLGFVILGIPAHFLLKARSWTAFWIWPILGFIIGGIMWYVFEVLFALSLGYDVSGIRRTITDPSISKGVLWPGGPSGLVVGAIFWLICLGNI